MSAQSIYHAAHLEAQRHRDEVVARLGPEHAATAIAEWNQRRFWFFALDRCVEHVLGERFWLECGRRNYAKASQRPRVQEAIQELRQLRVRLGTHSLPAFREKEKLIERVAELANLLLD